MFRRSWPSSYYFFIPDTSASDCVDPDMATVNHALADVARCLPRIADLLILCFMQPHQSPTFSASSTLLDARNVAVRVVTRLDINRRGQRPRRLGGLAEALPQLSRRRIIMRHEPAPRPRR